MPKRFKIYFKDSRIIELELSRFTIENKKLTLYDKYSDDIESLFISFEDIAAIIPNELPKTETPELFQVYLRKHKEPIGITAYNFEINEPPEIIFKYRNFSNQRLKIENLYIDLSEVLAIFPAEKLSALLISGLSNVSDI